MNTSTVSDPSSARFGTVMWFSDNKGFGFIRPDVPGARDSETFVHHTSVLMEGYQTLVSGQRVAYDVNDGIKGAAALNVEPVGPDGSTPRRDALGLGRPEPTVPTWKPTEPLPQPDLPSYSDEPWYPPYW